VFRFGTGQKGAQLLSIPIREHIKVEFRGSRQVFDVFNIDLGIPLQFAQREIVRVEYENPQLVELAGNSSTRRLS